MGFGPISEPKWIPGGPQNASKIIKMWKFAKILIDALVAIFGIYGVDFLP